MISNLYIKVKDYILGASLEAEKDLFEKVKIELIFNLALLFSIIYCLGFIKLIVNGYWYILVSRLVGVILIATLFVFLKKTKHYSVPVIVWVFTIALLGLQGLFISDGHLTYASLGFALLNVAMAVLMLNRVLKIVFFIYYLIFISYSLAVTYQLLPSLRIGANFFYDQNFFQSNILFSLTPFFLLIYVLYSFVTYEYKVKMILTTQIDSIVKQEEKIESANASMYKSIQFASKIQKAFLPDLDSFRNYFQDNFVFLKPKYELSGDFYWSCDYNDCFYMAIIDSSENNISGAIVSSIYFDALDFAVTKRDMTSTNDILCYLNQFIKEKADIKNIKYGINISIIKIDVEKHHIHFSSEKNALYFAKSDKKVIRHYRAESISENDSCIQYREDIIDFKKNDILYLTSDGFANQFEGFDNFKFKESVLKGFLMTIKQEPLNVQKKLLQNKLTMWNKGSFQSDDVCMIGIKF
ncbi:MAG: PP2C family protein-serine/threonine phosphatase [Crocinitomicaceae bacterium]